VVEETCMKHFMNAVSVCIAETQSLSCVLFNFCIMGLYFELFTSCNVFCMQAWHFWNFQFTLFLPLSSDYTQQGILNKLATLAHCRVLFVLVRKLITKSLNKWWISVYIFLPFTCRGIIFVHPKWPAYMWTTQQRKCPANLSVHSLGMLIAENVTLPQLRDFRLWTQCKWDLCSFRIVCSIDW
jgi:hypothetical protein